MKLKINILLAATLSITALPLHGMKRLSNAKPMHANSFNTQVRAKSSDQNSEKWYQSTFTPPNEFAHSVLVTGQITGQDEQPHQMIERVVNTIASAEKKYGLESKKLIPTADFAKQLGKLVDEHTILFSTPILTNAGRFNDRPLSACVVPPVNLKADFKKVKSMVDKYHQDGMGTGYNLSDEEDPVAMLASLNRVAVEGARSKKEQRPVGNIAVLNVYHPAIEQFIDVKIEADTQAEQSIFNISVDIDDNFMNAVKNDEPIELLDGKKISAKKLFEKIAYAAHKCADPGLISLARLNKDNPTPHLGEYKSTAPCAEVGLAPGETCVFGYINLANFVTHAEHPTIDFDYLKYTVDILMRALDNILEISVDRYSVAESKSIMQAKRKVGIGICGFADMLIKLGYSYEQKESQDILQNILNFISYHSKESSIELGMHRGSFSGLPLSKYMDESFIMDKYGLASTPNVTTEQWAKLATKIKETKILRNATTTTLPPTGRSALVIGASTGIEPIFSFHTRSGIHPALLDLLKKRSLHNEHSVIEEIKNTGRCPKAIQPKNNPFITATEISPESHLAITIAASKVIDESISKTVNLPENTTPEGIAKIYMKAYESGLKGISIYRDGSRFAQPKELTDSKKKDLKD